MKFNEAFTASNGIYTIFKEQFPEKYTLFYNDIEPSDNDMYLFYKYGEKTVVNLISDNYPNLTTAIKLVISLHLSQWEKAYNTLTKEYDFTTPYTRKTENSGTDKTERKTDTTDTNKNLAFNSEDFVNNEQAITDGKTVDTTTHGKTVTVSGNIGNKTFAELVSSELETAKSNLYSIIEHDIINEITLPIYESEEN